MTVQIRPVEHEDVVAISTQLGAADKKTLAICVQMSAFSWVGSVAERVACVWGLVPPTLISDQAYIWLYTTEVAEEHQFLLVRHSQIVIQDLLDNHYHTLTGHCLLNAVRSRRWLRWLGAKFGEPTGKGIPFVIRKQHG